MILILIINLISCKKSDVVDPVSPPVTVSSAIELQVVEWDEFSGHLESPQTVNLTSLVSGVIIRAPFIEGTVVDKGDVLFEIDNRPYLAELANKDAELAKAKAEYAKTLVNFRRYEKIKSSGAVSQAEFDQAQADMQSAQAQIAAAKAAQDQAKLALDWTNVTAPIRGRISKKLVSEGNLVNGNAGQATVLTTITSIDPLYCYVNVPENRFSRYRELIEQRKLAGLQQGIPSSIQLEGEKDWNRIGRIDFIDTLADRRTGTIQLRGVFDNLNGDLASGLFARLRVPASQPYLAILIPDISVLTDQNTKYVLVLKSDDTIEIRNIKLGKLFGKLRAIEQGLKLGEKVLVNGMQLVKPGIKVKATEIPISSENISEVKKLQSDYLLIDPAKSSERGENLQ